MQGKWKSPLTMLVAIVVSCPYLAGCSSGTQDTSKLPPIDESNRQAGNATVPTATTPPAHAGMSNGQKIVLLAGAAALYYMYKKNQQAHQAGSATEPQMYLSKNGRVYYREKGGRVHWVTAPAGGIQVPQSEAGEYQKFQGYDGQTTGRDLVGMGNE